MSAQLYAPVAVARPSRAKFALPGLGTGVLAAVAGIAGLAVTPALGCLALLTLLVALSHNVDNKVWLRRGLVALATTVAVYVVCALAVVCIVLIAFSSGTFG